VDGDGRDEVALVRGTRYRIYGSPESNDTFSDVSGSFSGSFAIANVDGPGVAAGPTLGVNPAALSFTFEGAIPPAQAVFISNAGVGDEFGWTAAVTLGNSWLSIDSGSGTTPATLSVSVDPTTLTTGTYQGQIRIDADDGIAGSPRFINVTLSVVVTLPRLGVSPAQLIFQMDQGTTNPAPQSVSVLNLGGGAPLSWTATSNVSWLEVTPTAAQTPTTAWVEIHGETMVPGTHNGSITFNAGSVIGSPFSLPITLIVRPPVLQVSPSILDLASSCSNAVQTRNLSITQLGGGSDIDWMATAVAPPEGSGNAPGFEGAGAEVTPRGLLVEGELFPPVDWITLSPDSGATPDVIDVQVDPSGLSAGRHVATIIVVGWPDYVGERIQTVDVSLFVAEYCVFVPLMIE
jgi:hypothetical protein